MEELLDNLPVKQTKSLLLVYPVFIGFFFIGIDFLFQIAHWTGSSFIQLFGLVIIASYGLLSFHYKTKSWFLNPLRILGAGALGYILLSSTQVYFGGSGYLLTTAIIWMFVGVIQITFLESRKEFRKKKEQKKLKKINN